MKIVLVGPVYPYRGGIAQFTARMAQAFQDAGHQVRVITFKGKYPRLLYKGKDTLDPSVQKVAFPAESILHYINPLTWRKAAQAIISYAPDHVIISWWTPFWAFCFRSLISQLQKHHISVGCLVHNLYPHEQHWFDPILIRIGIGKSGWLMTLNPREEATARQVFPEKQVASLPHPLFDNFRTTRITRQAAREKMGIPPAAFVVLFFGMVRPYKGLEYLLEATSFCAAKNIPVLTVVAGEFWEGYHRACEDIRHLGISESVRIDNRYIPNEEVGLFFSAADVLAAPYTGGTQSGVIKIAMNFGLPIIATEGVGGNEAPYYPGIIEVKPRDPQDLAAAMEAVYCTPPAHELVPSSELSWENWPALFLGKLPWKKGAG